MFTLSSSHLEAVTDAFYKSLNVVDLAESEEVEFIDGTFLDDSAPVSISGTLRLTSDVLGKVVSDRIKAALELPSNTALRIEIEPNMIVRNIEEDAEEAYSLIDTDNIDYTICGTNNTICVLSNSKGEFDTDGVWYSEESHYNSDNWERHSLEAPFVYNAIVGYLASSLHDDITLPLVEAFIEYHNW